MTSLALKPHLLRADTIDLQSHENPSAKDHTRVHYNQGYNGHGANNHTGLHHTQALRDANQDAYREMQTSPRMGGFDHNNSGPHGQMHMYDEGDEDDEDDQLTNGMNGSHDGIYDDGTDSQDDDMDDELLDKISSSPSIEDEDIDFEFVYALHTFVATVEGQANATKGETMVLLDDSNSYWWLVRVVKDGSIGYLPAEHIETPTERLARLNKHRNIDLAAAMLGDNPERTKNPLKKAMRRRNAKTVNFAPPTYYDADERVWSDEEDDEDIDTDEALAAHAENNASQEEQQAQRAQQNQQAQQTQQLVQAGEIQNVQPVAATVHRVESNDDIEDDQEPSSPVKTDAANSASSQNNSQDPVRRSRTGVIRNTDSYFKDETLETKKISLTPRLLRNDTESTVSTEPELKQQQSIDTFDKIVGEDKLKDGKKKEKKGMLSGLFKRKDKGAKSSKSDTDETDRISEESGRSPQSKDSIEEVASDRKPGKLQKSQPTVVSPKASPTDARSLQRDLSSASSHQQATTSLQKTQTESSQSPAASNPAPEPQNHPSRFPSLQDKRSVFAPITGALRSKGASQDMGDSTIKPIYSKRAKERFAIDDSDSEDGSTPTAQSSLHRSVSPMEYNTSASGRPGSDMRVSPIDMRDNNVVQDVRTTPVSVEVKDRSGPSQQTNSTASPTTPSDQTVSTSKQSPSAATHTPSTSRSTPTWSDASLRSYMDNDQDIRDLLVIVHDKTNITPVGNEHPLMSGLFASERGKLADMQTQLDSMLMTWLSKKNQPMNNSIAVKI